MNKSTDSQTYGRKLLRFPLLFLGVTLYLVMGFVYKLWHPAWVILIAIPFYYQYALSLTYPRHKKKFVLICALTAAVTFHLSLGFTQSLWHPTWLIYLIVLFMYQAYYLKE